MYLNSGSTAKEIIQNRHNLNLIQHFLFVCFCLFFLIFKFFFKFSDRNYRFHGLLACLKTRWSAEGFRGLKSHWESILWWWADISCEFDRECHPVLRYCGVWTRTLPSSMELIKPSLKQPTTSKRPFSSPFQGRVDENWPSVVSVYPTQNHRELPVCLPVTSARWSWLPTQFLSIGLICT